MRRFDVYSIIMVIILTMIFALATAVFDYARADETVTRPATVEIFLNSAQWNPGRSLAICVQTGLRSHQVTGGFRLFYKFASRAEDRSKSRSLLPELQTNWADTSYMLVDADDNLVGIANGQVPGDAARIVTERAINGADLFPGSAEYVRICGELTNSVVTFTPRESKK